jgi:hypothetical protein
VQWSCSSWAERGSRAGRRNVQLGDVADGGGVKGAVALDGRVDVGIAVDVGGGVGGDAATGLAADVPRRRSAQAPPLQDRVQRSRCESHSHTHIHELFNELNKAFFRVILHQESKK